MAAGKLTIALGIVGVMLLFAMLVGTLIGASAYRDGVRSGSGALSWAKSSAKDWGLDQFVSAKSTFTAPELVKLQLDIAFEDFEIIRAKRDVALAQQQLFTSDADLVPATITVDGRTMKAKVRLKGDIVDHLTTNKWSFRVELSGDNRVLGMRRFSIQHPFTRSFHFQQAYHDNLVYEGILAPRYQFVDVALNGEQMGVYGLEEFFGKELIESNGRRTGVLLGFDEQYFWEHIAQRPRYDWALEILGASYLSAHAYINVFDQGRVSKSPELQAQATQAVSNFRQYQEGKLEPAEVFDLEKMATYLAIAELWQAHHGIREGNLRFYYNPISGLLEPVGFDGDPTQRSFRNTQVFFREGREPFVNKLLNDPHVATMFMSEIDRFSSPEYLTEIRAEIGQTSADSLASLRAEFPSLESVWGVVRDRQDVLRKMINPVIAGIAYGTVTTVDSETSTVALDAANPLAVPIEVAGIQVISNPGTTAEVRESIAIDGIGSGNEAWVIPGRSALTDPLVFERGDVSIPASAAQMLAGGADIAIDVRVLGQETVRTSPVVIIPELAQTANWRPLGFSVEDVLSEHSFVSIESPGVLSIGAGDWNVNSDLVIPEDQVLIINAGATLRFGEEIKLVSSAPVHLLGNEDSPVILEPIGTSWAGVFVQRAGDVSIWRHAVVRDTRGIYEPGRLVTGGITFNESPLTLRNVVFDGSQAEDELNVVLAGIDFEDVMFSGTVSDGFDGDAVIGRLDRVKFADIGGDGLDVSASDIVGSRLEFTRIADKAISIGEASKAEFVTVSVLEAGIGVASKDLSYVTIEDADFANITHFALASYQKKPEYGPSALQANNVRYDQGNGEFAVEGTSELIVEGLVIDASDLNVDELYVAGILGN